MTKNVKNNNKSHTITKEKTPIPVGVLESTVSMTDLNVTKLSNKFNHNWHEQSADWRGGVARGGEIAFPSLSKGTLNHTSHLTNPNTNSYYIEQTLTKDYPKKVKHFSFKRLIKTRTTDAIVPDEPVRGAQVVATIIQTSEQEYDTFSRSIARTRREMLDIAECNTFDKFGTLTFDPKKHDAYSLEYCKKKIINWLSNQQQRHGTFKYLLVLELMDDGKIHAHVLLAGFTGKYHATNTRGHGDNARQCYKIDSWEKNYGFADMEDITDSTRTVLYLMKYIAKDITSPIHVKGAKRYYSSKNLMRPTKRYNETLENLQNSGNYVKTPLEVYENDYVIQTTLAKL